MEYTIQRKTTIDKGMILDIIETAGYSVGYWAISLTNDSASNSFLIKFDGHDFPEDSPLESGRAFVTYLQVAKAIELIATNEVKIGNWIISQANEWLDGNPTLDGDLADCIIQVATFGELIYG